MFGSDVLEVGIGLTLLFLVASGICSALVEMITRAANVDALRP